MNQGIELTDPSDQRTRELEGESAESIDDLVDAGEISAKSV
ncbi:MAG: hypothetical protein U5O39_13430 [Gammaproteobacteria bacterium]|nr:hypothetical protein [Gammaproteobacteria bacterium]